MIRSLPRFGKLTVEGLAKKTPLSGQAVLMRVDLNVPLDKKGTQLHIFWATTYRPFELIPLTALLLLLQTQ